MALSLFLTRLKRPAVLAVGLSFLCMFTIQEAIHWRLSLVRERSIRDSLVPAEKVAKNMGLPLVVSNGLQYLPIWYNADADGKSRTFFLADPEEQVATAGTDTSTLLPITLKDYVPVECHVLARVRAAAR